MKLIYCVKCRIKTPKDEQTSTGAKRISATCCTCRSKKGQITKK